MLIPTTVLTNPTGTSGGGLFDAYACLQDQKTAGTSGGVATTGAWTKHTLNTEVWDTASMTSLASDAFPLDAGTYRIEAWVTLFRTSSAKAGQCKIRNTTDGSDAITGSGAWSTSGSSGGDGVRTTLSGRITIASTKTFELHYQVDANDSGNVNSLGIPSNMGVPEVYAQVEIYREAA